MKKLVTIAALAALATPALAQESSQNRVSVTTDWSVFEETNPRECWAVSAPKETVNTRNGNVVTVNRGEILLMVFNRPGEGVSGQVAFTGGYPFASGSTVDMNVSGQGFELVTDGEWAWPATSEDDARIVAAMRDGAEAVVVGRSSRGTRTEDKFSLLGFTASVAEAAERCTS